MVLSLILLAVQIFIINFCYLIWYNLLFNQDTLLKGL